METSDYEITSGYVGSLGKTFTTATPETFADAVARAATLNGKSPDEITVMLESGDSVNWCKSPNYYYDHSYGIIRRKRTIRPVQMQKCSCGHTVPVGQVMSASLGTSCPDCYDRMSD